MTTDNDLPPGLYVCRVADVCKDDRPASAMERWTLHFAVSHMPHAGKVAAVMFMLGRRWLARLGLQNKATIVLSDLQNVLQVVRIAPKGNSLVNATAGDLDRIADEVLGGEDLLDQFEVVECYREVMAAQLAECFGKDPG